MSRLVRKKNNSTVYLGFSLLIVAIGAIALEYFGVVDLIYDFGQKPEVSSSQTCRKQQIYQSEKL